VVKEDWGWDVVDRNYTKRDLPCRGLIRRWNALGTLSILLLLLPLGCNDGFQLFLALLVRISIASVCNLLCLLDCGLFDV
jgi:hypothetical protein